MELMPHIKLSKENVAPFALLPGDPARLDRIADYLEQKKELAYNREFRSISGFYQGIPVLATSTGLGGPSAATAVEELSKIGVRYFIRIGSCGALQPHMKNGDLVLVQAAIRDEGTSKTYAPLSYPAVSDYALLQACEQSAVAQQFSYHIGLCRSHDNLYAADKKEMDKRCSLAGVLGSDMESAAILTCARLKGLHAMSILNVVVEYQNDLAKQINEYTDGKALAALGEQHEILTALEAFVRINKKIQA